MARRRMLDPEFFFDEELACTENSAYVRLFYQGLWCHCDDNFYTIPRKYGWLKAQIFPYEDIEVEKLWQKLVEMGKILEFEDEGNLYGYLKNFSKHQRVEKPSISKYPEYPTSRGVVGEESGSPPAKVKLSKVKLSKVEETASLTPKWFEQIEAKSTEYSALVRELAFKDYLSPRQIHTEIVEGFVPHWTETAPGATKARWQKEKSFDPWLRVRTWIKNFHVWKKDVKCREGFWHQKGETCHHRAPDPPEERGPIVDSSTLQTLANSKRV